MKLLQFLLISLVFLSCASVPETKDQTSSTEVTPPKVVIRKVNQDELPVGSTTIAIVGATLIDGTGKPPMPNAVVIVKENKISKVGEAATV